MHRLYIVQRKTLAKQFETFRNISNDLKTVSNQFAQLRKPLKMVCTPMTSISRRCMSPKFIIRSVTVGPKMLLGSLPNDVYSHHLSEAESAGVEKMATDGG